MASVVDVCNLALSHIGDRATLSSIDPPEGSSQADHCAQFWPIARDEALTEYDWKFASHIASPAAIDESIQSNPVWTYAYAKPSDFLVAREMVFENDTIIALEPGSPHFEMATLDDGTEVILSNYEDLSIRYTRRVNDPSRYPPKFVTAVSYLLASMLAGPVIKGRLGAQTASAMRAAWEKLASKAAVVSANQRHGVRSHTPAGLKARGYGGGTRIVEDGPYRRELPFWAQT